MEDMDRQAQLADRFRGELVNIYLQNLLLTEKLVGSRTEGKTSIVKTNEPRHEAKRHRRLTTMRNLMIAVLMLSVSVVVADEVSLGYFGETGSYDGAYMSASVEQFNVYVEHAGECNYTLAMLDAEVDEGLRVGMRFDSPSIWRPYVKKSIALGDGWVVGRWSVGGLGGVKQRFDIFAGYPINDWLAVEGWERYQSGSAPAHSWGPKVSYGDFSLWYGKNFGVGDDAVMANYQAFAW